MSSSLIKGAIAMVLAALARGLSWFLDVLRETCAAEKVRDD